MALLLTSLASLAKFAIAATLVQGDELLLAPPMVGRATERAVEMNVLVGERPVQLELSLAREPNAPDDVGTVARSVVFAPFEHVDEPFPHGRSRGVPAAVDGAGDSASVEGRPPALLLAPAGSMVELVLEGLEPGAAYRWRLSAVEGDAGERSGAALRRSLHEGRFVTARPRGERFTFGVYSDTHVFPKTIEPELVPDVASDPRYLLYLLDSISWYRTTRDLVAHECESVLSQLAGDAPDFTISLGDVFDLHGRGFNWAFDTQEAAYAAHLEARRALGALANAGAVYQVLGNWEGESGCHPQAQRELAILARQRHAVNPRPTTTRFGGSELEDYFAWEWGDALFVALNVRGYTPTPHHLGNDGVAEGRPDDFTLGVEQKVFLERTLAAADHRWKFLFLHHVVGGNAGNPDDSAYGRGGGRAARVGEQAWVHELSLKHGVRAIFYGHDHVFTDQVVDGIHYTLPGTTSAPWRFQTHETGYETFWPDSGYGRVTVGPESVKVEFVKLGGDVLHSFEIAPKQ